MKSECLIRIKDLDRLEVTLPHLKTSRYIPLPYVCHIQTSCADLVHVHALPDSCAVFVEVLALVQECYGRHLQARRCSNKQIDDVHRPERVLFVAVSDVGVRLTKRLADRLI